MRCSGAVKLLLNIFGVQEVEIPDAGFRRIFFVSALQEDEHHLVLQTDTETKSRDPLSFDLQLR